VTAGGGRFPSDLATRMVVPAGGEGGGAQEVEASGLYNLCCYIQMLMHKVILWAE
jgi:hypothetical protein